MLSKLAMKNVKRSIKDYIIYLITITLALSFTYALNLVSWSDAITNIASGMNSFKQVIIFVNIIIVFVIAFLINYTIKFMFEKRSKEFGTYMLLGIKKKKIIQMFLWENISIGLVALILSIPIGFIISQFISLIIVKIIELPQTIFINFNTISLILLIIYFISIYIVVLFLAYFRIKKISIYNLLYLEKQNEEKKVKTKKHQTIIFIISILLGLFAFLIWHYEFSNIKTPNDSIITYLLIGVILFIISMYGVMFSLSDFLLSIILKNKKIKYTKDNLFIARTFSSKIRTMGFTLGTIGLLVMFTLISLNLSSINKGVYDYNIEVESPFDISLITDTQKNANRYLNIIKQKYTILNHVTYQTYLDANANVEKKLSAYAYKNNPSDKIIKLKDYNNLLKMKGKKPVTLKKDEYLLVVESPLNYLKDDIELKNIKLSNNITLKQKGITNNLYFLHLSNQSYAIIVNDECVKNLPKGETFMSLNTKEKIATNLKDEIVTKMHDVLCENEGNKQFCKTYLISIKANNKEDANIMTAMLSTICIYMAFIFTATTGTILAITSLSETNKYKYRYNVLNRLGVKQDELYKTVRKQLYLTFGIPIIYPIIISFGSIYSLNKIYKYYLVNENIYLIYFLGSLIIFLIIYSIYLIVTYFGIKRNIKMS